MTRSSLPRNCEPYRGAYGSTHAGGGPKYPEPLIRLEVWHSSVLNNHPVSSPTPTESHATTRRASTDQKMQKTLRTGWKAMFQPGQESRHLRAIGRGTQSSQLHR